MADTVLMTLDLADDTATTDFGRRLAPFLREGDVLLLNGPIGAGKTHFSRGLIRARLGWDEDVPSPTFTLIQTYDGMPDIWHADLYRLTHPDEVTELGLEDAFSTAICLIEWPERLGDLRPDGALTLNFRVTRNGDARAVDIIGPAQWGARLENVT